MDAALRRTAACVPLERFDAPLSAEERQHVQSCARCQAELALWEELREPAAGRLADEAEVQWIAGEVARRRGSKVPAAELRRTPVVARREWLAAAALAAFAVTGAYLVLDREPRVTAPSSEQAYRSTRVEAVSPLDDVKEPPTRLEWTPLPGATAYDVRVSEVDGRVLWQGSSAGRDITLPASVTSQIVPGRTLLWDVRALNQAGEVVGESGTLRFKLGAR
jgi:hypothetical protein